MAQTLSAITISTKMTATLANAIDGSNISATAKHGNTYKPGTAFTNGTTANKADKVWQDRARSLSGATSENIDVYDFGTLDIGAGAGLDALGQAITLAEIVYLFVENNSTSTGDLTIGAEGSAAAWNSINGSDTVQITTLSPGAWCEFFDPTDPAYAVADTSNHLLKMASSATLTYDILILGRSA